MSGAIFRWAAPLFARGATKRWTEDHVQGFVRMLAPFVPPNGRLLDLAGGSGRLAGLLAAAVPCTVTVLDSSPNMLRYAGNIPGVEPVLGDAAALPFADASFDAVLVCDAFHHFVRTEVVVREMARVVRPGGGILIAELDADARSTRVIRVIEKMLGEPGRFLRPSEMEKLMAKAGVHGSSQPQRHTTYVFVGEVVRHMAQGHQAEERTVDD